MSIPPLPDPVVDAVDVYWRPGCGYCTRLLRTLQRSEVVVRLHDIWTDDEARAFVRAHNRGNETVPTVAVGDQVWCNPPPAEFVAALRRDHPDLVGEEPRRSRLGRR